MVGLTDGILQIRVAAPPFRGNTNQELLAFISWTLGMRQDSLAIVKGHTSRNKATKANGLNREEAIEKFFQAALINKIPDFKVYGKQPSWQ
ncbi:MAG: DUF167 domain-containing protein [Dehalococcoidales bacterium]|nr:DUF167 domain-containing protein [Dehalococcoidales bacterium]